MFEAGFLVFVNSDFHIFLISNQYILKM